MSRHVFSGRGAAKAFLFFMVGVIGVGAAPAAAAAEEEEEEGTPDKVPALQELRKKFAVWRGERDELQKRHQDYHQKQQEKKRQEQRRNFLQGQHDGDQVDFDNIMPAPDDPELWPLWRDWLTQWRKDKRAALDYDDSYYSHEAFPSESSSSSRSRERGSMMQTVCPGQWLRSTAAQNQKHLGTVRMIPSTTKTVNWRIAFAK